MPSPKVAALVRRTMAEAEAVRTVDSDLPAPPLLMTLKPTKHANEFPPVNTRTPTTTRPWGLERIRPLWQTVASATIIQITR